MPTSIDPLPKDDEVECGNCGVYLLEPGEPDEKVHPSDRPKSRFALWVESMMRKLRGEPHVAEELFSGALREAALFDDLLKKVGGDRAVVERLIDFEKQQKPNTTRSVCLQNAIDRWERENR